MSKSVPLIVANLQLMAKKYHTAISSELKPVLDGLLENPIDEKGNAKILEIVTAISVADGLLRASAETNDVIRGHILDSTVMMLTSVGAKINAYRQMQNGENTDER